MSTSGAPHVPGRASPARDDTVVFAARARPADPGVGVDDRMNRPAAWAAEWAAATSDVDLDDLLWRHRADGSDDRPEMVGEASHGARQLGKSTRAVEEVPKVSDPSVRHGHAQGELEARAALPAACFRVASGAVHPILRGSPSARFCGADARTRTADLLITNQLLYQLSYVGVGRPKKPRAAG